MPVNFICMLMLNVALSNSFLCFTLQYLIVYDVHKIDKDFLN